MRGARTRVRKAAGRRALPAAAVAVLAVVLAIVPPGVVPARATVDDVTVLFADQQATLTVPARALALPRTDLPFLRSADVAAVFRLRRGWDPVTRRLLLEADGRRVTLTADSRLVRVDTVGTLLREAPVYRDGELWLPLELVTRILPPVVRQQVTWEPRRARLTVRTWRADVTGLTVTTGPRRTVLRLTASRSLPWRVRAAGNHRLRVTVAGATVDTVATKLIRPRGLVSAVHARQSDAGAEVTVILSPLAGGYDVRREDGGRTLALVLREEEVAEVPLPAARGRHGETDAELAARRPLRLVVIDPGHGGTDPGVTAGDAVEKELMLDLALELRDCLRRAGFRVELTRDDDATLSLDDRAAAADRLGGDLFLSLHADAWPGGAQPRGALIRVQRRAAVEAAGPFVRWDAVQQRYLARSAALADTLAARLTTAGWPVRGVARADLPLLRPVDMPAVLLETGVLTNTSDRRILTSPRRRRRLVDAVVGAVSALSRDWAATAPEEE